MSVEARSARGSHLPVFECIEISSGVERKGATAKSYRFERFVLCVRSNEEMQWS